MNYINLITEMTGFTFAMIVLFGVVILILTVVDMIKESDNEKKEEMKSEVLEMTSEELNFKKINDSISDLDNKIVSITKQIMSKFEELKGDEVEVEKVENTIQYAIDDSKEELDIPAIVKSAISEEEKTNIEEWNDTFSGIDEIEEKEKFLVAVYGTLKKGLGNHHYLKNSTFKGIANLKGYDMYAIGTSFPAVVKAETSMEVKDGVTEEDIQKHLSSKQILVEIYEVDKTTMKNLDFLEGNYGSGNESNMYNLEVVNTYLGASFIYLWNNTSGMGVYDKVESGIWQDGNKKRSKKERRADRIRRISN